MDGYKLQKLVDVLYGITPAPENKVIKLPVYRHGHRTIMLASQNIVTHNILTGKRRYRWA